MVTISMNGFAVKSHRKMGRIEWNQVDGKLWLPAQRNAGDTNRFRSGKEMLDELSSVAPMNACFLDFFESNPFMIPLEWKREMKNGKYILFWGTQFGEIGSGESYVRGLSFRDGEYRGGQGGWPIERHQTFCYSHYSAVYQKAA